MKRRFPLYILIVLFASCQTAEVAVKNADNSLNSTLWIQTAAEYEALSYQAYNTSCRLLETALEDSSWTASLEQRENYSDLPPAIILDLDETAIDNSFYEARGIIDNTNFDPETWNEWVREREADAIKGAVELTTRADELGIAIFYITNRDADVQEDTEQNLKNLGFPVAEGSVMSNGGRPEWTSAKIQRRSVVAADHRVLMLFGDDLNDFLPALNISIEERKERTVEHKNRWGVQWFILPNPNYGSWERALYTGDEETEEERQQTRLNRLETKRE